MLPLSTPATWRVNAGSTGGRSKVWPEQPQIDLARFRQRAGRLLDVVERALVGQPAALEPADAGVGVAVQRIGRGGAPRRQCQAASARPVIGMMHESLHGLPQVDAAVEPAGHRLSISISVWRCARRGFR